MIYLKLEPGTPTCEAVFDALTQYIQNSEEIEHEMTEKQLTILNAARKLDEVITAEYCKLAGVA